MCLKIRVYDLPVLQYKGYTAKVEWDEAAKIFHGEVSAIRDVITSNLPSCPPARQTSATAFARDRA